MGLKTRLCSLSFESFGSGIMPSRFVSMSVNFVFSCEGRAGKTAAYVRIFSVQKYIIFIGVYL